MPLFLMVVLIIIFVTRIITFLESGGKEVNTKVVAAWIVTSILASFVFNWLANMLVWYMPLVRQSLRH